MQFKPADSVLASAAKGILAADLSISGTSFTLQAGQGAAFPASDFSVEINGETIDVGTRTNDTFSSLTRANPVPHNGGARGEPVYHVTSGAAIATAVAGGGGGSQTLAEVLVAGNDAESGTILNLGNVWLNDGDTFLVALQNDGDNIAKMQLSSEAFNFDLDSGGAGTSFAIRQDGSGTKNILRIGWNDASEIMVGYAAGKVGFYGTPGVSKQTGVAVDAAGIHAALVNLGLIAA